MKSSLLLMLPGMLTACQGDGLLPYYDGSPPEITGISVSSEPGNTGGQVVELTGSGFGDDPAGLTVVFGYNNAEILSADEVAYLAVTNDYFSCYAGVGNDLDDSCQDSAWSGLTGVGGKGEFLTYAFPRVHTLYTGERFGYGTSPDWSYGQWAVETPTQDFISVDIEAAYADYRVEIEPFQLKAKRWQDQDWLVDMSLLATYRYDGGDTVKDDDGNDVVLPAASVIPLGTLAEQADESEADEPWVESYDAGAINFCMVPEYDTPRTWEYESDWPVGNEFFRGPDGSNSPATVYVDIEDVGINDVELLLPPHQGFVNTIGSAAAGASGTTDWALYQTDSSCPDSDGDGVTGLNDAVWRWEWEPFQGEYTRNDQVLGARTYVRITLNILNIGWYGGSGIPMRAVMVVPDDNNLDEETGLASVEIPAEVMYQFPTAVYDAGPVSDPFGNTTGYKWGDPSRSDYQYMIMVLERVTEYKIAAGYSSETEGDVEGSLIFAYSSGDVGFMEFDNPLDRDGCGNCQDGDGDGWVDELDPDCQIDDAVDEDNSTFGDFTCNDGLDNDSDGLTDAEDPDCTSGDDGETNCSDGIDNDGDGFTDEEDGECLEDGGIEAGNDSLDWLCANGLDDDGDGWVDIDDPDCVTSADDEVGFGTNECNDGVDNDGHGDVDAFDFTCARRGADHDREQPEIKNDCVDGIDNDGDLYVDGNDPDCEVQPYASETNLGMDEGDFPLVPICYNSVDDDGDGWIDFEDIGCVNEFGEMDGFASDEQADLPGYTTCTDEADNDGDGWIDALDPDCIDPLNAELFASWSPHGFSVVYVGHNPTGDSIYIVEHVENPVPKLLVDWKGTQTRPSFSPDGGRVAFYSNHMDPGRMDLYVMTLGSKPYPVAQGVVMNARGPTWTPDGSQIIYVLDDDERYDPVYSVPVTKPEGARKLETGTVGNSDLDVTRGTDGRAWLAVAAQGRVQDTTKDFKRIYVMELP